MPSASLTQLCDLVSDVAITNARTLRQKFSDLAEPHSVNLNADFLLKAFAFMNWTFAQGVWSNLQNTRLRRDLQIELKDFHVLKLAAELSETDSAKDIAARAVFLTEDFNAYVMGYTSNMQIMGYADSRTARLFALERIQEEFGVDDYTMKNIVPLLWSDEKMNSEVESVAMQVNKAIQQMKSKGFFRRLFGM